MLDLIEEGAFVATGSGRLQPEIPARDAEAALAFLVEQGMVEVAGDTITVPARFWSGGPVPGLIIHGPSHPRPRGLIHVNDGPRAFVVNCRRGSI